MGLPGHPEDASATDRLAERVGGRRVGRDFAPGPARTPAPERRDFDQFAALKASYTFLGMRPRGGTSMPCDWAQARTVAGSGATAVRR